MIEKMGPSTDPYRTPRMTGDEGDKRCGIEMEDVRDDKYEVNRWRETEDMPNKLERQ